MWGCLGLASLTRSCSTFCDLDVEIPRPLTLSAVVSHAHLPQMRRYAAEAADEQQAVPRGNWLKVRARRVRRPPCRACVGAERGRRRCRGGVGARGMWTHTAKDDLSNTPQWNTDGRFVSSISDGNPARFFEAIDNLYDSLQTAQWLAAADVSCAESHTTNSLCSMLLTGPRSCLPLTHGTNTPTLSLHSQPRATRRSCTARTRTHCPR